MMPPSALEVVDGEIQHRRRRRGRSRSRRGRQPSGPRRRPRPAPASSAGRHSRAHTCLPPLRPHHGAEGAADGARRRPACSVVPTMPRMSYSRRIVGSKLVAPSGSCDLSPRWRGVRCAARGGRRRRRRSPAAPSPPGRRCCAGRRSRGWRISLLASAARSRPRNSFHSVITTSASAPSQRLVGVLATRSTSGSSLPASSMPSGSKARTIWRRLACSAGTMSSDGASRMSSVLGLKVRPSTRDRLAGDRAAAGVDDLACAMRLLARVVDLDDLSRRCAAARSASRAVRTSASVSLGKHEPPIARARHAGTCGRCGRPARCRAPRPARRRRPSRTDRRSR